MRYITINMEDGTCSVFSTLEEAEHDAKMWDDPEAQRIYVGTLTNLRKVKIVHEATFVDVPDGERL